ncbi:MAG: tetratricopeptide repeat protein [Bacteroidales bacterium]|nr:tetratricopeptide repeat protein [Bacteroidales bacterium]
MSKTKTKYQIKYIILTGLLFILTSITVVSQKEKHILDSLKNELRKANYEKKIKIYVQIGSLYSNTEDIESLYEAKNYLQKALSLAQENKNTELEIKVLFQFSKSYYNLGNTDESIEYSDKALALADETKNEKEKGPIYRNLSSILFFEEKYDTATILAYKAIDIAKKYKDDENLLAAYEQLSSCYLFAEKYLQARDALTKYLELAQKLDNKKHIATAYEQLGMTYYSTGDYEECLKYWEKNLEIRKEIGDKENAALAINNIGVIYKNWGNYRQAIENFQEALKIQEEIKDTLNIARALTNIGNIYYYFGLDMDQALLYYKKGLKFFETTDNKPQISFINLNIGLIYTDKQSYDTALIFYNQSLDVAKSVNNQSGIAMALDNIGTIYSLQKDYKKAEENINQALKIYEEIGDVKALSLGLANLAEIKYNLGNFNEAILYYNRSIKIARELNLKKEVYDNYKELYKVYAAKGNYKKALEYFENYSALKDSVLNEDYLNQINELQTKYETEKKEAQIELQNTEIARQNEVNKRQKLVIIVGFIGVIIILGFLVLVFRQNNLIKKVNRLLADQNIEIKKQRDQIFQQKQEITDSIHYASRIQNAILPPSEYIAKYLPQHFILFKPRDIVSGDFYWMSQQGDNTYITAVDCTGHGVPGAFMSMLGTAFLNEIISKNGKLNANEVLNELRNHVVKALHQRGAENEAKDGMDMALCVINHKTMKMQYAGAFNPLYFIRNNELIEYKPTKMPIGIYTRKEENFACETIDLQPDDTFYIFSDGYVDQFGGEKRKKFMSKNLKELILQIQENEMPQQGEILNQTIEEWMKETDQVDDILVIGIRI